MKTIKILLLVVLLPGLAACTLGEPSKPSRFYVLDTRAGTAVTAQKQLSIGVGPVFLPDILDRPQIVTRADSNRIDLAEFDRWGGDLDKNLLRVLAQNLMQRLDTDEIVTYPWPHRDNPDLQVSIRFFRFDGVLGQPVILSGIWQILDGRQGCLRLAHRFEFAETPADNSYAGFVDALSRGVAGLSQTIAGQLAVTTTGC